MKALIALLLWCLLLVVAWPLALLLLVLLPVLWLLSMPFRIVGVAMRAVIASFWFAIMMQLLFAMQFDILPLHGRVVDGKGKPVAGELSYLLEVPPADPVRRFALWELGFRPFYLLASAFASLSILLCMRPLSS